jgi:hypothetical protein
MMIFICKGFVPLLSIIQQSLTFLQNNKILLRFTERKSYSKSSLIRLQLILISDNPDLVIMKNKILYSQLSTYFKKKNT